MFKIYKAEKVNLGEPKPIKHANIKLISSMGDKRELKKEDKSRNEMADDIIEQAKLLYADIINEANNEAIKLIEVANKDIEKKKKEEFNRAYKEGLESGYKDGKEKANSIIEQAITIKDFLEKRKEEIFKESEKEIIHLVIDSVKKLVGQELSLNNEIIISLIKKALEKSTYKNSISIRVSTEDYIYVLNNKDLIKSLVEGVSDIDIIEDKFLKKGDCILDTPGGQINTSIQLQIKELEAAFIYALGNE